MSRQCFSPDWQRSRPDYVIHLPTYVPSTPEHQDHILVARTTAGTLLAIWTVFLELESGEVSTVFARSTDEGHSWSDPIPIHEPNRDLGHFSWFGFPIVSRGGRIYCFYNYTRSFGESRMNSVLRCKYSDNDGLSWVDGDIEYRYRRTKFDNPEPDVYPRCLVWQKPIKDANGRYIAGITRRVSTEVTPAIDAYAHGGFEPLMECRCEFMRFENIDDNPNPHDIEITWLPDDDDLISVPIDFDGREASGHSYCQEPSIVLLPDGRLFCTMRTANGSIYYTVSEDSGNTWTDSDILRYYDHGPPMHNPTAPCPIYRIGTELYLLFHQGHDGWGSGGKGPLSLDSRRPQLMSIGKFAPGRNQPIWFGNASVFYDTKGVGIAPFFMDWISMYSSVTRSENGLVIWYTDRKLFTLGKILDWEFVHAMDAPW